MQEDCCAVLRLERIRADAVSQIMLNVILRQQAASHVRIASGEGVDECQRLFRVAQGLRVCRSAKADHGDGNHGENQYERDSLFILSNLLGFRACFRLPLAL